MEEIIFSSSFSHKIGRWATRDARLADEHEEENQYVVVTMTREDSKSMLQRVGSSVKRNVGSLIQKEIISSLRYYISYQLFTIY